MRTLADETDRLEYHSLSVLRLHAEYADCLSVGETKGAREIDAEICMHVQAIKRITSTNAIEAESERIKTIGLQLEGKLDYTASSFIAEDYLDEFLLDLEEEKSVAETPWQRTLISLTVLLGALLSKVVSLKMNLRLKIEGSFKGRIGRDS